MFVENRGQWEDQSARLVLSGKGVKVALTAYGAQFQLFQREEGAPEYGVSRSQVGLSFITHQLSRIPKEQRLPTSTSLRMKEFVVRFAGAQTVVPAGEQPACGVYHFRAGEPDRWRESVPAWETAVYRGLYEAIDLRVRAGQAALKYEFIVAPGGDWRRIQLRYDGIERLELRADGALVIHPGEGWPSLVDEAPIVFQEMNGRRVTVAGRFVLVDERTHGFEITGAYDQTRPLVIDPEMVWSTDLGGSSRESNSRLALDGAGNVFVAGTTSSGGWVSGGWNTNYGGSGDGFVVKLSATGHHLWSTYLGGTSSDTVMGLAVDGAGNVLVAGETLSTNWVTGGWSTNFGGFKDGFVTKFSAVGEHLWSTYVGGSAYELVFAFSMDGAGDVLVAGRTRSGGWVSGWDSSYGGNDDGFVVKLSATGQHLWSTYLGDDVTALATDSAGNVLAAGTTGFIDWISGGWDTNYGGNGDGFVVKFTGTGQHLWSTYLGGSNVDFVYYSLAVDGAGNVVAGGRTTSSGWVSGGWDTNYGGGGSPAGDGFVVKLSAAGEHLWSTYLGGADNSDGVEALAVDKSGNVFAAGSTGSSGWASGGWDTNFGYGNHDGFIVKLSAAGQHLWSTYVGGGEDDLISTLTLDESGSVLLAGTTPSPNWISGGWITNYGGGHDGFVVKLNATGEHLWSTYLGGSANDEADALFLDQAGHLIVAGSTFSTNWVNGEWNTNYNGGGDAFVVKIRDRSVPGALGSIVEVRALGNGNLRLTFEATGYSTPNLVVESAAWPANPIQWDEETVVIKTNTAGNFEAELPMQGSTRFYRVKAAP